MTPHSVFFYFVELIVNYWKNCKWIKFFLNLILFGTFFCNKTKSFTLKGAVVVEILMTKLRSFWMQSWKLGYETLKFLFFLEFFLGLRILVLFFTKLKRIFLQRYLTRTAKRYYLFCFFLMPRRGNTLCTSRGTSIH